ncbi:MAG: hypothetical protein PHT84_06820, partial [Candidatus Pacebacteria bacterium]|nr:hypothetical protein [Candidatus Paceibacterota bacterium]
METRIIIYYLLFMKNILKRLIFVFTLFLGLLFGGLIFAEDIPLDNSPSSTPIHLSIISGENTLFDEDVSVSACDSDNDETTPDIITPYCAILQTGLSSNWNWSWAPGAFVDSIEDIAGFTSQDEEGNDVYHYWSWSLNSEEAMIALNQYELEIDDIVLLEFISPVTESEDEGEEDGGGEEEDIQGGGGKSSGSSISNSKTFSLVDAVNFLKINQKANGSFVNDLYTDWVAIGLGGVEGEADLIKEKLIEYLSGNFSSDILTDYQRRAMALMSLGVDPYLDTDVNYIEKIVDSFDGEQIGDVAIYNDDIFGILVLSKVGYSSDDQIISKTVDFIVSNQESDGSWEGVD